MNIKVLNEIENTILEYGKKHAEFVDNPYWYFAEKLGYKSKNYLYRWFRTRNYSMVSLSDVKKIIEITGRKELADIIAKELKGILVKQN